MFLHSVPDRRDRRGQRYPLAALLMIGVRAIVHWAKLRKHKLSRLVQLKRQTMPHYSSWSHVPGQAVKPGEVEQANEITTAPKAVQALDLRGVVVTGDAMQAQRELSVQFVEAEGDYLWTAKDHQPEMREEIALLFQPQQNCPGCSALSMDFRTATTFDK